MSDFGANLSLVQVYLDAKTRDDIIRIQYINNILNQVKFNYSKPVQLKNGTYEVWFYADITNWKDPRELDEDEVKLLKGFRE